MQDGPRGRAEELEVVRQHYGSYLISCIDKEKPGSKFFKFRYNPPRLSVTYNLQLSEQPNIFKIGEPN